MSRCNRDGETVRQCDDHVVQHVEQHVGKLDPATVTADERRSSRRLERGE
jgi:hypothetical protein